MKTDKIRCQVCDKKIRWYHRIEIHIGRFHWVPGATAEVDDKVWVCSQSCWEMLVSAVENGLEFIYYGFDK